MNSLHTLMDVECLSVHVILVTLTVVHYKVKIVHRLDGRGSLPMGKFVMFIL
jgi:hypothetical protein